MAKKTGKTTREQMYREIIEKEGRKWPKEWRPATRTTGNKKPHPVSRARRSKYRVGDTWVKRHGKDREFPG